MLMLRRNLGAVYTNIGSLQRKRTQWPTSSGNPLRNTRTLDEPDDLSHTEDFIWSKALVKED